LVSRAFWDFILLSSHVQHATLCPKRQAMSPRFPDNICKRNTLLCLSLSYSTRSLRGVPPPHSEPELLRYCVAGRVSSPDELSISNLDAAECAGCLHAGQPRALENWLWDRHGIVSGGCAVPNDSVCIDVVCAMFRSGTVVSQIRILGYPQGECRRASAQTNGLAQWHARHPARQDKFIRYTSQLRCCNTELSSLISR